MAEELGEKSEYFGDGVSTFASKGAVFWSVCGWRMIRRLVGMGA
jgi:hypothetical protein